MNASTSNPDRSGRVFGALALELAPGTSAACDSAAQVEAGGLAALVAADLAKFAPEADALDCTLVAAHFDPVELLRPGWPIHQELWQLAAKAPRAPGGARLLAFGSHEGRLPGALSPATEYSGGPLRLLPWVLDGDADVAARVAARCEADLMEEGMAGAGTALAMQEAFGMRVEHARHLTLHDLCALTAMQYGHAGLEPLWPLLETALLAPAREAWLDAPPEPLLRYADGIVRMAMFSPAGWRARHAPDVGVDAAAGRAAGTGTDAGAGASAATGTGTGTGSVGADLADEVAARQRLERLHDHYEARQRQFTSVLRAHGLVVEFIHCQGDARAELAAPPVT